MWTEHEWGWPNGKPQRSRSQGKITRLNQKFLVSFYILIGNLSVCRRSHGSNVTWIKVKGHMWQGRFPVSWGRLYHIGHMSKPVSPNIWLSVMHLFQFFSSSKEIEMGLWITRYVCTACLFLLGFIAPGIAKDYGRHSHLQEDEEVNIVAWHLPRGSKLRWHEDMSGGLPSALEPRVGWSLQSISLLRITRLSTNNAQYTHLTNTQANGGSRQYVHVFFVIVCCGMTTDRE